MTILIFLCSLVYGLVVWTDKAGFWEDMTHLYQDDQKLWSCMGYFNDITCAAEKQGRRDNSASSSHGLAHFMQSLGFVDLGFAGSKFTWCNRRPGFANIQERLDRGISNFS